MIDEGQYERIQTRSKFPVDKYQKDLKENLKVLVTSGILATREAANFVVPNPSIPRLYALLKTHKPGNKMRPIASNINATTSKIAKYLTVQAKKLKKPQSFSIKNSQELIEAMKDLTVEEDEVLVSFDVESLFPSVPTEEALKNISSWLNDQDIADIDAAKFLELSKIHLWLPMSS